MQEKGLKKIAAKMRQYATQHPRTSTAADIMPYQVQLAGGLGITLYIDLGHKWHLTLGREGVEPSETELKVVKRDFDIPKDALETRHTVGGWRLIRLRWKQPGKPLFELQPAIPIYEQE